MAGGWRIGGGRGRAINGDKDVRKFGVCFNLYIYTSFVDWDLRKDLDSVRRLHPSISTFPRKRLFLSVDALQVIDVQRLRLCSEISPQEPKRM